MAWKPNVYGRSSHSNFFQILRIKRHDITERNHQFVLSSFQPTFLALQVTPVFLDPISVMKCFILLSFLVAVAYAGNGDQQPKVWDALDKLRGKAPLATDQIQEIYANAQPGQDFPTLSEIPQSSVDCAQFKQPGFYADEANQCQVFHRCDVNGNLTSYLCPNMSVSHFTVD